MYVRNLFLAKEGMATTKPNIIDIIMDTIEMYIVVVKPLIKNLRFVNPSTLFGDNINQLSSLEPHEVKGSIRNRKNKFLTLWLIKN